MTIQQLLHEVELNLRGIEDSASKILAQSGSAGVVSSDNLGDINNHACDVLYFLEQLKKIVAK